MLKLFRRLEQGRNPELEMGQFLNRRSFLHSQTVAGGLEYVGYGDTRFTLRWSKSYSLGRQRVGISHSIPSAAITTASAWVAQSNRPRCRLPNRCNCFRRIVPRGDRHRTFLESANRLLGVGPLNCTRHWHRMRITRHSGRNFHAASSARGISIHAQCDR